MGLGSEELTITGQVVEDKCKVSISKEVINNGQCAKDLQEITGHSDYNKYYWEFD